MGYAQLLEQYIQKSGLNLTEITEQLKEKGITIDRSYISKLKSGAKPPASEEVTKALAEITGGDPEMLVNVGVIEKTPEEIKAFISEIEDILWDTVDYILVNGDVSQLRELITHIQQANLQSPHLALLNLRDDEKFKSGAIAERLSILQIYSKETFSLSDKLKLFLVVIQFFKKFNELPLEKVLSAEDLQANTILGPMEVPKSRIHMIITSGNKESLTEDEGEFLTRCLETYRIQKEKWT
ncbi:helix-turn-helix domain-containing protein [Paenibacillus sp. FJAT-26967]|uniref:helix-turn-helix domain-containing protein n=1 Tax=Paenibacillus sp. FJAT-26967 TaxID=1729690 RepID=UPI000838FC57|nr:helix-turn-helix domain-containing protein [Paenibacillus sp. FJAT-26967]